MTITGRPGYKHYKLMLDLLYSQADYIDRLPEDYVVLSPNQYMIENNINTIAVLKTYVEILKNQGYLLHGTFKYGRMTCQIAKP